MTKKSFILAVLLVLIFSLTIQGQIKTNKNKLITMALEGKIAPTKVSTSYTTTWNGKSKLAIGVGGINYDLQLGEYIFGWASGDRATMGVATIGEGNAWKNFTSIGNKVKVMSGAASGEHGVITGKFESYVLVHFEKEILDKLTIGSTLQVKASGVGLKIDGYKDVFLHGISAEALEKLDIRVVRGKLEVPVVSEIPAEIMGQGAGRGSLSGNWHIQTCYPPDIKKYGLNKLRFGDLVILQDTQTDYGMGYYKGGATIGIICSSPSDISGMGIGVTPIISTRFGKICGRIDRSANIGKYLGLKISSGSLRNEKNVSLKIEKQKINIKQSGIETNKNKLLTIAVQGKITPVRSRGYSTTYTGKPRLEVGMGSINYTVSIGDSAYGWANADHVEPDVSFSNLNGSALGVLGCIGNQATIVTGEAKGAKGFYIGKHGSSIIWFPKDVLSKLSLSDRVLVKARGVGLKIKGFDDVRVNKISPELLENLGIKIKGKQLVVPVVKTVPGYIMGSGMGMGFFILENVDYDIQTTCPEIVKEHDLKTLRLGDIVAIKDHYDYYGRGRYKGAVTIGVIIHGWSEAAGHGPGVTPILSALPGKIKVKIDPDANTAYYLGIKKKPVK